MRRMHRLFGDVEQLLAENVQIGLLALCDSEVGQRLRRAVPAAIEAPVYGGLDADIEELEARGNG